MPATHFIDAMMQALGRRYCVSLISAAELHGAVKPAESEPFQVMVDRHVPDRDLGTTRLWFYTTHHAAYDIGIEQHQEPTGSLRLASRELTAVDLIQHANDCGGIDYVAALLDTLGPLRIPKLAEIAGMRDLATARRLGYLLSRLDPNLRLGPLPELADLHRRTPTDLVAGGPRRGHIDPHWNVRVNYRGPAL